VTITGVTDFGADMWHTGGGLGRLYFASSSGITYIKGGGIYFRNASDTTVASIDTSGNLTLVGATITFWPPPACSRCRAIMRAACL